jgi:2-C-methyl-D-erythritol 4-phosphate cytidylyltransferase
MGGVKKEYQRLPRAAACGYKNRTVLGAAASTFAAACGSGSRTVLGAAASTFAACPRLSVIVISVPSNAEQGEQAARQALPAHLLAEDAPVKILFAAGGASRRISVLNALTALEVYAPDYVLIHDGARPWISPALINSLLDAVQQYKAVIPAMPAVETPKQIDGEGFIIKNLTRRSIVLAQTPQAFAFAEILGAHRAADQKAALNHVDGCHVPDGCREYTDDAEVWGAFNEQPIKIIDGDKQNVKITFREDLY